MNDVEFYERQVKFQENLAKIQEKRSLLEQEFFNLTKTDRKLQSIRTTKLRSYWKKICERERKANERNAALLRDVKDFEDRLAKVTADTARLERIKEKCENELTKIYPQWRYEIDLTKAKKQLEDGGVNLDILHAAPPTLSSILNRSQAPPAAGIEAPLFKLVPYNFEREQLSPNSKSQNFSTKSRTLAGRSREDISQPEQTSSFEKRSDLPSQSSSFITRPSEKDLAHSSSRQVVTSLKPKSSSKELQSLLKPETSKSHSGKNFPLFQAPPASISTSSSELSSEAPFIPPLELQSLAKNEHAYSDNHIPLPQTTVPNLSSQESSASVRTKKSGASVKTKESGVSVGTKRSNESVVTPDPVPSLHRSPIVSEVHQVEINTILPPTQQHKDNILNDLSDLSTSSISFSSNPDVELEDRKTDQKSIPLHKNANIPKPNALFFSETAPKSPPEIVSAKTSEPIKIPIPTVESIPSESLTTEPSQKGVPLTSNPAYQNMLRSNEMSSTFGMSQHLEEDDDELEKMVSPKPKEMFSLSDEDDDSDVVEDENSFNNSKLSGRLSSGKNTPKKISFLASSLTAKPKAPWDTDSGEDDSYKIPKAGRFSAEEDDFDFYD